MSEIHYSITIDGEEKSDTFTPDDVSDPRAGYRPDVARAYAQIFAVEKWGLYFDVNDVEVQIKEDHSQYDETGSTGGGNL